MSLSLVQPVRAAIPTGPWTLPAAAAGDRRSDSTTTALRGVGPMSRWYLRRARWLAARARRTRRRRPRALPPLVRIPPGGLPGRAKLAGLRSRLQHLRSHLLSSRTSDPGACFSLRLHLRRWLALPVRWPVAALSGGEQWRTPGAREDSGGT